MAHAKSWIGLSLSGLLATSFCAVAGPADAPYSRSLYARLGGAVVMTTVIDKLIERAAADPKLKRSFDRVDLARVKRLLVEQICSLAGGGCTYSGDSMHDVHAGLGIDQPSSTDSSRICAKRCAMAWRCVSAMSCSKFSRP